MSLHERIKEARKKKGFTQEQLGQLIGVAKTTIAGYEKNREPTAAKVGEIADILDVDVNFLFQDEFKMLHENRATNDEMKNLVKIYRDLDDEGKEHVNSILEWESKRIKALLEKDQKIKKLKEPSNIIDFETAKRTRCYIKYLQRLAGAGKGMYLFDDIPTDLIAVEDTPLAHRADFVIGVNGDSMEPTFYDGDKVYVEKMNEIPTGSIGIFINGNECYIKELGVDRLISHNKEYDDILASPEIRCVGLVLGKAEILTD